MLLERSQVAFLDALAAEPDIDWLHIVCFNMDNFWDPRIPEQYSCGWQTRKRLYDKVGPKRVELIRFNATDAQFEAN